MNRIRLVVSTATLTFGLAACGGYDERNATYDADNAAYETGNATYEAGNAAYEPGNAAYDGNETSPSPDANAIMNTGDPPPPDPAGNVY